MGTPHSTSATGSVSIYADDRTAQLESRSCSARVTINSIWIQTHHVPVHRFDSQRLRKVRARQHVQLAIRRYQLTLPSPHIVSVVPLNSVGLIIRIRVPGQTRARIPARCHAKPCATTVNILTMSSPTSTGLSVPVPLYWSRLIISRRTRARSRRIRRRRVHVPVTTAARCCCCCCCC